MGMRRVAAVRRHRARPRFHVISPFPSSPPCGTALAQGDGQPCCASPTLIRQKGDRLLEETRTIAPASMPPTVAARKLRPSVIAHGEAAPSAATDDEEQPGRPGRQPEPADAPTSHETRRRRVMLIAGAAVALAAVGIGARYYVWALHHESTDDAFIDGHIVHVAPQVGGRVRRVFVTDNQPVRAGHLLVEIDPADFRVKLDQ